MRHLAFILLFPFIATLTLLLPACPVAMAIQGTGSPAHPIHTVKMTDAEMENLVRRSYQYVALYNTLLNFAVNKKNPFASGGWNKTHYPEGLMDASVRAIPRPNNDTLYVLSLMDLRQDPVVIHYPAFDSKFVSLETSAMDHYVEIPLATSKGDFKKPTTILYYSARTEGYKGEAVRGVDKIMEMSGDFAIAFLRVMPEAADPAKFKANMAALHKVKLQTLSEFQGKPRKPADKIVLPPYGTASDTFAHHFLPVMQFVFNHTTFDPGNDMDQKALAALRPLGVKPGRTYHASRHDEIDGEQLAQVAGEVAREQLAIWNDPKKAALLTRLFQPKGHMDIDAMVLQSAVGPLGQPADQAMYPGIATADGKPMNAQHDYVIRMTKAELPPAIAFWSLTLYDAKHGFFIPNKQKKYSVGQNAGMKLNASGGIEVYIAAEQPKGVPAENWLPITREDLDLDVIMRVYQPDLEKMKTWKAPKAERVDFAAGTSPAAQASKSNQSLEYELALQRGTQAVIWGLPAVSMKSFFKGMQDLGAGYQDIVYVSKPFVSRHGFITANNNVPYVAVFLNTKQGPVILDVPAASEKTVYFGSILDMWQTPIADVGPAGDDKGKGGKYLFLPPGYKGSVPDGYMIYRPKTYTLPVALRPVSRNGGTLAEAVAYAKSLRAYDLKDAANPPAGRYIDAWSKAWDTLPVYDETFFRQLAEVINDEPVLERDLAMMGLLWSIGIRKGQPFKPEGDTAAALKQAVQMGYDILQARFIAPGGAFRPYGKEMQWLAMNLDRKQAEEGFPFVTSDRLMVDERGLFYFWGTFLPKHLGGGTFYLMGLRDKNGDLLDGKSLYRLRVPRDVPAREFWSAIAYSMKTKGFIENTKPVGLSSQNKDLKKNADGTHDIYFGPTPPKGMASNWVQTGEDFFLIFRLYGPAKEVVEGKWTLNDVEKVQ